VATVGMNFKRIRTAKKITQEEIYKKLGFRRPANVSLLETSQRLPRPSTIQKMAAVLGCETWELLEGVETPWDALRHRPGETSQTPPGHAIERSPPFRTGTAKDHPRKRHRRH
jgi:transcriptional regulator with XRE-family HTH domain